MQALLSLPAAAILIAQVIIRDWRWWVSRGPMYVWCFLAIDQFRRSDYSISKIYQDHGIVLGTVILLPLAVLVPVLIYSLAMVFVFILNILMGLSRLVSDQGKLAILSIRSDARPHSAIEAIHMLPMFKTTIGKAQYIHALLRWLPVETDMQVFVEEAVQQDANVRDAIFQLVEIWEDSMSEKARRQSRQ